MAGLKFFSVAVSIVVFIVVLFRTRPGPLGSFLHVAICSALLSWWSRIHQLKIISQTNRMLK